jgi:hypothetical protein
MMLCCIRGRSGPGLRVHITSVSSKTRTTISRARGTINLRPRPASKYVSDLLHQNRETVVETILKWYEAVQKGECKTGVWETGVRPRL